MTRFQTPSIAAVVAHFAHRRGLALPPGWQHLPGVGALDGGRITDLAELCDRAGWSGPQQIAGRPRPGDFPLLAFDPRLGWTTAEQYRSASSIATSGTPPETVREIGDDIAFFSLPALPAVQDRGTSSLAVIGRAILARKGALGAALIATIMINLIALATSLYSMQIYDRVIPRSGLATLWVLTIGVMAALLFDFALRTVRAMMMEREASRIDAEISGLFYTRAEGSRLDARPQGVGTLAAQVRGVEHIRGLLSSAFIFLLADLPFALLFIVVIAWLGGSLATVPVLAFPLTLLAAFVFARMIRSDTAKAFVSSNRKNGLLVETFDAAETIKANHGSWELVGRWNRLTEELERHELPVKKWTAVAGSVFSAMQQVTYIAVVAFGAVLVADRQMTMGSLVACTILIGRVTGPLIAQLPNFLVQWGYARSSLGALDAILALPSDDPLGAGVLCPEALAPSIACEGVSFAYPGIRSSLSDVSLTIGPGEKVAVIGTTGSGKSTLLRLLAGLYAPAAGSIRIGGLEMRQVAPEVLRSAIGYVPQDTRLLNGTLRGNLLMGLGHRPDDLLAATIDEVGLGAVVADHPLGLDLPIAEGGLGLSGGQRTLANIARLLLGEPALMLLDEPTANLDQVTEARVLAALQRRMTPDRTLVLVTHRPQLLALADRVVVLHNGRVAEDGPTERIVARLQAAASASGQAAARSVGARS